jgi:hypothetical protein
MRDAVTSDVSNRSWTSTTYRSIAHYIHRQGKSMRGRDKKLRREGPN